MAIENGVLGYDVRPFADAETFARLAAPLFAADPVGTNVLGTVLAAARLAPPAGGAVWVVVDDREGRPVGLAMRAGIPDWHVGPMPDGAAAALARTLHRAGYDVPGAGGDGPATRAFVRTWKQVSGARDRITIREGIRVLTTGTPPPSAPGHARPATVGDLDLVTAWMAAFSIEAHPQGPPAPVDAAGLRRRISAGQVALWTHGGPVSLAARHAPISGVARVGPVFTPREHRGHGYASAVTWAVTTDALEAGAEQVMLFTDLSNATSNGLYARLGFELVRETAQWSFG